jgi:hypothetical protein
MATGTIKDIKMHHYFDLKLDIRPDTSATKGQFINNTDEQQD